MTRTPQADADGWWIRPYQQDGTAYGKNLVTGHLYGTTTVDRYEIVDGDGMVRGHWTLPEGSVTNMDFIKLGSAQLPEQAREILKARLTL